MGNRKSTSISRRTLIRSSLVGGAALAAGATTACASRSDVRRVATDDPWRQFAGTTLNFVSESTAPTAAIAANLEPFVELTGININIVTLELSAMTQKVALDLAGGQTQYQLIYADPYNVLAPYSKGLVDLRELAADPTMPRLEGGFEDFIDTQLDAAGKFGDGGEIFAIPYDCPTMIWQYRADLFDKYHDRMANDLGFDPIPGEQRTWQQYYDIAEWFNRNADEVPYGAGHQCKQHGSLMCDFSNVLWAFGGDYFPDGERVGRYGTRTPGPCLLRSEAAIAAAEFYHRLIAHANPSSVSWDWNTLSPAFQAGRFAMCVDFHENAASNEEAFPGKMGFASLPHGPARSANMYGGTGISISANTLPNERRAAWLFVLWSTSIRTQLDGLASDVGGGTPTRKSIYELPEVKAAETRPSEFPNILTAPTMRTAWSAENIGLRPKIPMWNECETTIYTQLSRMLAGELTPEQTMRESAERIDRITERGWVS